MRMGELVLLSAAAAHMTVGTLGTRPGQHTKADPAILVRVQVSWAFEQGSRRTASYAVVWQR